jgi:hypothetical protein
MIIDMVLFMCTGTICDNAPCRRVARCAAYVPNTSVGFSTTANHSRTFTMLNKLLLLRSAAGIAAIY